MNLTQHQLSNEPSRKGKTKLKNRRETNVTKNTCNECVKNLLSIYIRLILMTAALDKTKSHNNTYTTYETKMESNNLEKCAT